MGALNSFTDINSLFNVAGLHGERGDLNTRSIRRVSVTTRVTMYICHPLVSENGEDEQEHYIAADAEGFESPIR